METILVADDEADIRRAFRRILETADRRVVEAADGTETIRAVARERPDLVVMDIRMGATNGLDTLKKLRELDPKIMVIMMTAFGTTQTAIEAMKLGAFDYILKPFEAPKLKELIDAALKAGHDMRSVVHYPSELAGVDDAEEIVGRSDPMQKIFKIIGQVAQSDATVFITGESGTGKELVARAIYHHSQRANRPFMAINCAAIPEQLLESELFGHERGSFTGASEKRIGKFEQCDTGTIFLDEIGDMPAPTQTKILRVLQDGEFQRVGGNQTIRVDVRVIAATNRDPEELVRDKKFREDLFYRLHVVRIEMPPLRDRRGDIPLLVDYFLRRKTRKTISADTMELLKKHPWPGNVRELENAVERAAVMARTNTIMTEDLPPEVREPRAAPVSAQESDSMIDDAVRKLVALAKTDPKLKLIAVMERELIACALKDTGGNQVKAAKLLGITRATLRKRIEKFGIERRIEVS